MDDMVESFTQSWVVEDVLVDHFRLPDYPYFTSLNEDAADSGGTEPTSGSSKRRHDGADPPRPTPSPLPSDQAHDEEGEAQRRRGIVGHFNYMLPQLSLDDADNVDSWLQYQQVNDLAMQDADFPQRPHTLQPEAPAAAPPTALKWARQSQVDRSASKEAYALSGLTVPVGAKKEPTANGKVPEKEEPRVDLVLDISEEKVHVYHVPESEKGLGATKHPNIHWGRRSRLVKEEKRRDELHV